MTWQRTLRVKTRQPEFLWGMVIGIAVVGIVVGIVVDVLRQPTPMVSETAATRAPSDVDPWTRIEAWAEQGQWLKVWWAIPQSQAWRFRQPGTVALAGIAGLAWLVFLIQAMKTPSVFSSRMLLALSAVALGIFSIWPNSMLSLWQEQTWGIRESTELMAGVRFYVLGVGLREESAKLLCYLPLIPILLRIDDDLVVVCTAGCVGLGFAMFENTGYYAATGGIGTLGRFLTANPAHVVMTSLIGLSVYRALRAPKYWASHAVTTFLGVVLAHGAYDAFIALPDLADLSLLSMIVFVLLVYQFFHHLRELRRSSDDTISLTATFVGGVTFVSSAAFVYLCGTVGREIALTALADEVTGLAVIVYLFLREMPETLMAR